MATVTRGSHRATVLAEVPEDVRPVLAEYMRAMRAEQAARSDLMLALVHCPLRLQEALDIGRSAGL